LSILNFTLVISGNAEYHFDFFGTEKQEYSFVEASIKALADKISPYVQYKDKNGQVVSCRIHLWSDCELRTYGTVVNIHQLTTILKVQIIHTFFPRYHGHSRCDAHFGRGKMQLRKLFPSGGLENVIQVISIFQEMKDTFIETVKFDNVQQEGSWVPGWNVKSVQQIRYLHGSMFCKKLDAETIVGMDKGWVMVVLPRWTPRRKTPSVPTAQSSSSHPHMTLLNPKYEDPNLIIVCLSLRGPSGLVGRVDSKRTSFTCSTSLWTPIAFHSSY